MVRLSPELENQVFINQLSLKLSTEISNSPLALKLISFCISRDPEVISRLNQLTDLFKYPEDMSNFKTEGDFQANIAIIQRNPLLFEELLTSILRNFVQSAYTELKEFESEEFKAYDASQVISNGPRASSTEQFEEVVASFALSKVFLVTKTVPTESFDTFRINLEYMLRTQVQDKLLKLGHKLEETPLTPHQLPWLQYMKDRFKTEFRQRNLLETSEEEFADFISDLLASFTARHAESLSKLTSEENPQQQREVIVGFVVQRFVSLQTNLEELLKAGLPDPFPYFTA